jgi:hypothetical protein
MSNALYLTKQVTANAFPKHFQSYSRIPKPQPITSKFIQPASTSNLHNSCGAARKPRIVYNAAGDECQEPDHVRR